MSYNNCAQNDKNLPVIARLPQLSHRSTTKSVSNGRWQWSVSGVEPNRRHPHLREILNQVQDDEKEWGKKLIHNS